MTTTEKTGKFLLGAGTGAIIGLGALAFISLSLPMERPAAVVAPDAGPDAGPDDIPAVSARTEDAPSLASDLDPSSLIENPTAPETADFAKAPAEIPLSEATSGGDTEAGLLRAAPRTESIVSEPSTPPEPTVLDDDVAGMIAPEFADPAAPTSLTPVAPLPRVSDLPTVGRLPQIQRDPAPIEDKGPANSPAPQVPEVRLGAETSPTTDQVTSDKPPMIAFARAFSNSPAKPVFAIVLIDDGAPGLDREALAALPFPVSFALDPLTENAQAHAAIYRAGGQEVIMLGTGVPEAGNASDVEIALGVMEETLPQSVAVMDLPGRVFQNNRPMASLVVPGIEAQGRGLLTWDEGLNAANQIAQRSGLASGVIFRNLDGGGESQPVIRRYLDRAAFKAAQDGRVIVAGSTASDTVAALIEWTLEGRAATVALAPITAALNTP